MSHVLNGAMNVMDEAMSEAALKHRLLKWITQDCERVRALELVLQCAKVHSMPQWCLAAGFVRNLVWDRLHGFELSPLNDIDLIYFCPLDISPERDLVIETYLNQLAPELPWSVKNQARMHTRNQDTAYTSCVDAMAYWPELETAIGVSYQVVDVESDNQTVGMINHPASYDIELVAPFGLNSLFALKLSANPKRSLSVFDHRVATKGWLTRYPLLECCRTS
ncbi:nucleotidyltransferase family protein [Shewanella baltica]|uniref:nucleotidyltransferase family protein n=1 Tax=Shewanella baltica TaxID=62322 RepID=UPI00217CEB6B|nr:nucleotidyltransferase family protein [Shewanella baltica]MCS6127474.1 nucleotidyltransferase family protein [Shewanella baltica]MCS6139640.1 nucleotidyltransferase family protein [Shewanella baltica]MCS6145781.1 nucleotidyltransferase family protein [Shewanella baltica]MCS6170310.1 nucleotidyltransferase family protein [Shewanella baltica]MCS6187441.1 nucleotidyltransferase family protein [Shewanella baltica]